MAGEELSSTDLHLANGDTLLVGQVSELTQIDVANHSHMRKLQVTLYHYHQIIFVFDISI